MIRKGIIALCSIAVATTSLYGSNNQKIAQIQKQLKAQSIKIKALNKKLNKVKAHDAFDNVKFGIDFRSGADAITVKNNKTNEKNRNDLFSTKLYLSMMSSPSSNIVFKGKLGIYNVWGGHPGDNDKSFKGWQSNSKANNNEFKLKEAYVLYTTNSDIAYSIGRRPSTEGFLANYRNNTVSPNSPLAHVTNMEVDAMMARFGETYTGLSGSYVKFIYGRAHDAVDGVNGMYTKDHQLSNENTSIDDQEVDFYGVLGNLYDNGTYKLMYQYMVIDNTKGSKDIDNSGTHNVGDIAKAAAGKAYVSALSFHISGLDMLDEDSDFLADTNIFASIAQTNYKPEDGYTLLGTSENTKGKSYWVGVNFPDMITDGGKFGIEYNEGDKNWTPFTWAEDTIIGSKIAVRGHAKEVYWNTKIGGSDNLSAQIRYTKIQHNYTPSQKCQGWIKPESVDITSTNLGVSVRYRY